MGDDIKRTITNTLATTALAVIVLALIVRIQFAGYDLYFAYTVLSIFGANIVIHMGLLLTKKFESKYLALEILVDMVYTTVVLIVFGLIFEWFSVTPVWVLGAMAVLIYLVVSLCLNMARIRKEADTINNLLKKRDRKQAIIGTKG